MSRTQFYEYKRPFQEQGIESLRDLPPIHKSHPQTTPPEIVERVRVGCFPDLYADPPDHVITL